MHALPEENVIGKFTLAGKRLDFIGLLVQPRLTLLRQSVERAGELLVAGEFQPEALKGEQDRGERARHHHALLIRPGWIKSVRAEMLQVALWIAGHCEGLHRLVR